MRKITKESAKAFVNFKPYKKDNTEVLISNIAGKSIGFKDGGFSRLYLHGNQIAEIFDNGTNQTVKIDLKTYLPNYLSPKEKILKLSDDSFDPDFAKRVFESRCFRNGTDLNAITDF